MVAESCQSKGIDFAVVNRGDLWHGYSWSKPYFLDHGCYDN